jgi:hypothetical protein
VIAVGAACAPGPVPTIVAPKARAIGKMAACFLMLSSLNVPNSIGFNGETLAEYFSRLQRDILDKG